MKPELLSILQHSLGVDRFGRGHQYRNHFVTGPDTTDWPWVQELVGQGFMEPIRALPILEKRDHGFRVTAAGKAAMIAASPPPPKVSRGRGRYLAWLRADCGMSFAEFTWGRK